MGGDWMSTVNSPHHFYVQRSVTKNGVLQLKYLQGPVGYWNSLFQWIQGLSITEIPLFYILVNEKNHCKLKMNQCFLPENASGILFLFYILFTAFQETMNQSHYSNNKYLLYNIKFKPSPFTQLICPSMSNHSEFSFFFFFFLRIISFYFLFFIFLVAFFNFFLNLFIFF